MPLNHHEHFPALERGKLLTWQNVMCTSLICSDLDEVLASSADVLSVPCRFVADKEIK